MPDNEDIIRRGRAYVRLTEAVGVLLQQTPHQHELLMLCHERLLRGRAV